MPQDYQSSRIDKNLHILLGESRCHSSLAFGMALETSSPAPTTCKDDVKTSICRSEFLEFLSELSESS